MKPPATGKMPIVAPHAVAATGHPFATRAAIEVLAEGGNAVDAALTASAVLCVVKPDMCGLGGDGFAQVVEPHGAVMAYNAGGTAGSGATLERFPHGVPRDGLRAACVPGLPDLWALLHQRHATRPLARLLAPAVALAADGFPVSAGLARSCARARERLAASPAAASIFLRAGRPPEAGAGLRQPDLARSLTAFVDGGRDGFYDGEVGRAIAAAFAAEADGQITAEDLRGHAANAAAPLGRDYRGYSVCVQPPTSQGHILLQALLLLAGTDLAALGHGSVEAIHRMIEAKKLAFADRTRFSGDPRFVAVDWDDLLSPARAHRRAQAIDPACARSVPDADSKLLDTTQFAIGDADGRAVSCIQSLYHPFGCAAVAAGTGVLLNNRMLGFATDPALPNALAPGKRTLHTLHTYTLFRDGRFLLAGGTPGADYQVQTNLQILSALIDHDLDVAAAVAAPRWGHGTGLDVLVESRMPQDVRDGLAQRGHRLRVGAAWAAELGCAQLVRRREDGAWEAVADPRREGSAQAI